MPWRCMRVFTPRALFPPPRPAEYMAKLARIRKTMATAESTIVRVSHASAALRQRLEEKDRERAAKRVADASAFSSVASR